MSFRADRARQPRSDHLGILPDAHGDSHLFSSYTLENSWPKTRALFGKGANRRPVAGPESGQPPGGPGNLRLSRLFDLSGHPGPARRDRRLDGRRPMTTRLAPGPAGEDENPELFWGHGARCDCVVGTLKCLVILNLPAGSHGGCSSLKDSYRVLVFRASSCSACIGPSSVKPTPAEVLSSRRLVSGSVLVIVSTSGCEPGSVFCSAFRAGTLNGRKPAARHADFARANANWVLHAPRAVSAFLWFAARAPVDHYSLRRRFLQNARSEFYEAAGLAAASPQFFWV